MTNVNNVRFYFLSIWSLAVSLAVSLTVSLRDAQRGITTISLALILGILAFFVLIALTLIPVYLENYNVAQKLKTLKSDPKVLNMSESEIMDTLFKRFSIDNVESVLEEDVLISKEGKLTEISIEYEVRKSLVGNIDVVVRFFDKVEIQ